MARKVGIQDVAREAGVSVGTVSKVLIVLAIENVSNLRRPFCV